MDEKARRGNEDLVDQFGSIDIYVFDQLLRGNITTEMRVLDAGCGPGRNSKYLMRSGAEVFGVDVDPGQIARIQALAFDVAPDLPAGNFSVAGLTDLPFPDAHFGAVICNTVLHFAADEAEFEAMVSELWRVVGAGGILFTRLASTIGIESRVQKLENRRHHLPDGSDRFLVDEAYLLRITAELGAEQVDPIKTTNVQNLRAMTTWVLRKPD